MDWDMSASKTEFIALGKLIELCDERNSMGLYGMNDVMGMTITKEIIPTKADVKDSDLSKYLVVRPNEFVYNPRTHGKHIGLGCNKTEKPFLISWNNTAFRIIDQNVLDPDYLYMYLNRLEWDRNACFRSWGSSTEVFSWTEFCLMTIPIPSIETQREIVAVYNGLKNLAEENEALLRPLSESCQAFIVDCKKEYPIVSLGKYIAESDERNDNEIFGVDDVRGVSNNKELIYTKADMNGVTLSPYKVLNPDEFCYVTVTSRNGGKISLAKNNSTQSFIVSSSYVVFRVIDTNELLPDYLFLHLNRPEFDRYSRFNSWGSARETFDWDELCRTQIPLPPKEVQQSIVNLYRGYEEAKQIATQAREQLKTICAALVQKAAHSV